MFIGLAKKNRWMGRKSRAANKVESLGTNRPVEAKDVLQKLYNSQLGVTCRMCH